MKKTLVLFAIAALVSCGTPTTTEVSTDSTAVASDSSVVTTDTTKVDSVVAPVDSAKVK